MEYRAACEKCAKPLEGMTLAYICSFECTWCSECAASFEFVCPNCRGELVRRPRRGAILRELPESARTT